MLSPLVKLRVYREEGKVKRQLQNDVINVIETPRAHGEEASITILEDQGIFSQRSATWRGRSGERGVNFRPGLLAKLCYSFSWIQYEKIWGCHYELSFLTLSLGFMPRFR